MFLLIFLLLISLIISFKKRILFFITSIELSKNSNYLNCGEFIYPNKKPVQCSYLSQSKDGKVAVISGILDDIEYDQKTGISVANIKLLLPNNQKTITQFFLAKQNVFDIVLTKQFTSTLLPPSKNYKSFKLNSKQITEELKSLIGRQLVFTLKIDAQLSPEAKNYLRNNPDLNNFINHCWKTNRKYIDSLLKNDSLKTKTLKPCIDHIYYVATKK